MEWLSILYQILQLCVVPILGVLTTYAVSYIETKRKETTNKIDNETADKYVNMLASTITNCVIATNQTYVEALKKDNAFTAEAQKEAFTLTYNAVMNILSDEAKVYLTAIYGDLTAYITTKIEAEVQANKK